MSTLEGSGFFQKRIISRESGEEVVSPLKYNQLKRENEELKRLKRMFVREVSLK